MFAAVVLNLWLTRYVKLNFTVSLQGIPLITVRLSNFLGDFPGGPMVKTLCSQHREGGFETWTGNKGEQPKTKQNKKNPFLLSAIYTISFMNIPIMSLSSLIFISVCMFF